MRICYFEVARVRHIGNTCAHPCNWREDASMKKVYERALGVCYEILDQDAYEKYWFGKSYSTREAFEAWLKDPNATQNEVARRYGRMPNSIFKYVSKLRRQGILRRFKKASA